MKMSNGSYVSLTRRDTRRQLGLAQQRSWVVSGCNGRNAQTWRVTVTPRQSDIIIKSVNLQWAYLSGAYSITSGYQGASKYVQFTINDAHVDMLVFTLEYKDKYNTGIVDISVERKIGSGTPCLNVVIPTDTYWDTAIENMFDGCSGSVGVTIAGQGNKLGCPDYDPTPICPLLGDSWVCEFASSATVYGWFQSEIKR